MPLTSNFLHSGVTVPLETHPVPTDLLTLRECHFDCPGSLPGSDSLIFPQSSTSQRLVCLR